VKTRSYTNEPTGSETPDVSYFYDNLTNAKGKLIKVTNGLGDNLSTTEYTSFDILGRVTAHKQTTDNNVYATGYEYNLAGALIEETYPSGEVVRNTLDSNGDLMAVLGRKTTHPQFWAWANNFKYNAAAAVTSMQLGNGLWESTKFNERLQPTQIALGSLQNGTDKLKLNYEYGALDVGTGQTIAGTNNGNVSKQTITVQTVGTTPGLVATQYYAYDSLNRIEIATENVVPDSQPLEVSWRQHFKFDRYGNRNFVTTGESATTTLGTCPTEVCNPTISPNTNKITSTGYSFDASGNTTGDAQDRKFTYDAENKQTKAETLSGQTVTGTIGEYWYDGDGRRVKKRAYANNVLTEETIFVYDAASKLVAEYSNQVASAQDAKVAYLTNDHLGSPRVNTDISGNVTARHDYNPFGEEIASSKRVPEIGYADDSIRKQFTGYERDVETQLDSAQARVFSFTHGRFLSTDPIFLKEDRLTNPQQFNLFAYADNNPLKYIDPTGMAPDLTIIGDDATLLAADMNHRDGAQFQIELGEGGLVGIAGGADSVDQSQLSDAEQALFDAITDPANHGVLMGVPENPAIEFGTHTLDAVAASNVSTAVNLVDTADVGHLRNASPTAAGEAVSHEALEAYSAAKSGTKPRDAKEAKKAYSDAHDAASKSFPEPRMGPGTSLPGEKGKPVMTGVANEITYTRPKEAITVKITFKFVTPIPRASIRGHNAGNMTSIEVVKKK
jgi:RHS repeat-associated protein